MTTLPLSKIGGILDTFWVFMSLVRIENFFLADISTFFIVALIVLKKFSFDLLFAFLESSSADFDFSKAFSFLFKSLVGVSSLVPGFDLLR